MDEALTWQGAICLDTLSSQWSPVLTIKSALISLQSLLSTPEPKDPQDAEVASMLIRNPAEFDHKAREWAVKYAGAPKKEFAEGSGGATAESITKKRQEAKQNEEKVKLAAYVFHALCSCLVLVNMYTDTMDTTRTLSTASSPWVSTWKPL
jgi:hypothetical protein